MRKRNRAIKKCDKTGKCNGRKSIEQLEHTQSNRYFSKLRLEISVFKSVVFCIHFRFKQLTETCSVWPYSCSLSDRQFNKWTQPKQTRSNNRKKKSENLFAWKAMFHNVPILVRWHIVRRYMFTLDTYKGQKRKFLFILLFSRDKPYVTASFRNWKTVL